MKNLIVIFFLISSSIYGQTIDSLYKQADDFGYKYGSKYYYALSEIKVINDTHSFWYRTSTPKGTEFFIIDAKRKDTHPAFDQKRLADALSKVMSKEIDQYKLPFNSVSYSKAMDSLYFEINGESYTCNLNNYNLRKSKIGDNRSRGYWGGVSRDNDKNRIKSPDNSFEAYISEGNLWITELKTGNKRKLSNDGSVYEYYSSNIYWSPDSKKIVCCKFRPVETRKLLLISSSPSDQLQPKTEEYDYPKPGDALPIRRPVVFFVEEDKSVQYEIPNVEQQYDLSNVKWDKTSSYFTFNFNRRGHQQYVVYAGDITGNLRTVVDEQSNTFIYYNALYEYWFKDKDEMLWISERDGWRHIYLYDVLKGTVKKQLTKGEWVVKSVVNVDEKNRTIIFKACGMDKDGDPYLEKYYTLNIDNGEVKALTPENANHNVTFSSDYSYFVDSYSRVDLPPTIVLRSSKDGSIIAKPKQQPDISKAVEAGWKLPEVFSAKGRDNTTDIWGMIIRPSNFDSNKKYPVIEYIYAGPHDSHVPKSFAINYWGSQLAELGFIVIMIDGMGTSNRSKAFHDVCWKNLKDAGFPDRIAWIKAAAKKYPEMDISQVGIFGTSAGGQNAMGALLFHPEFYKVGVSSCGCHDNRMDKIWWNEQWMGYPVGKEYEECSNVVNAKLLQGNLMLILGELDNNVDPSSTLQVVDELIKHDKDFEFVMLPGARHTSGEKYGERKRRDFFVKHLLGIDPPKWNNK